VKIRVVADGGEDPPDSLLKFRDAEGRPITAYARAGESGTVAETALLPGDYEVEIAAEGFEPKRETVHVEAAGERSLSSAVARSTFRSRVPSSPKPPVGGGGLTK
jgi:hypothetical protein